MAWGRDGALLAAGPAQPVHEQLVFTKRGRWARTLNGCHHQWRASEDLAALAWDQRERAQNQSRPAEL